MPGPNIFQVFRGFQFKLLLPGCFLKSWFRPEFGFSPIFSFSSISGQDLNFSNPASDARFRISHLLPGIRESEHPPRNELLLRAHDLPTLSNILRFSYNLLLFHKSGTPSGAINTDASTILWICHSFEICLKSCASHPTSDLVDSNLAGRFALFCLQSWDSSSQAQSTSTGFQRFNRILGFCYWFEYSLWNTIQHHLAASNI